MGSKRTLPPAPAAARAAAPDGEAPAEGYGAGLGGPEYALVEIFGGNTNLSRDIERNLDDIEAGIGRRCEALALVDTRQRERAQVLAFRGAGADEGNEGAVRRELAHEWGDRLAADTTRKVGEFLRRARATFDGARHLALGFRGHGDGLAEFAAPLWARGSAFAVGDVEPTGPGARGAPELPSLYDPAEGLCERRIIVDSMVGRALSLADVADALGGAFGPGLGKPADVLFFDSCLSGSVEMYEELRPYARAFVASEHLLPASGLPYGEMLRRLNAAERRPGQGASVDGDWAKVAIDAFAAVYRDFRPSYSWSLAAFRTFERAAASPIARAWRALVGALQRTNAGWRSWPAEVAGGACPSYGTIGAPYAAVEGTLDLLDLAHFFAENARSSAEVKAAAGQLLNALRASCLGHAALGKAAALGERCGGLSIWLAPGAIWQGGLLPAYKALAFNRVTGWADYVESLIQSGKALERRATPSSAPAPAPAPLGTSRPGRDLWGGAARKALVIGCDTFGLRGSAADAERAAIALEARGFRVEALTGDDAKREAILARYDALIASARPDDAALVFFSGHGGLVANPMYRGGGGREPEFFQFLVPADFGEGGGGPFRGVLSYELSLRLSRLTERTRNATVVLDCCHAAQMSRHASLVPKALPLPIFAGLDDVLARLPVDRAELASLDALGNPHALRLVACDIDQVAYERREHDDAFGLLTDAFVRALAEAGSAEPGWGVFLARVRELVGASSASQRPSLEGPSGRALFSLRASRRGGVLSLQRLGSELALGGGRLAGVAIGDEFALMPLGAARDEEAARLATLRVTEVGAFLSRVELETTAPEGLEGAPAFPIYRAPRPLRVWFRGPTGARRGLAAALAASRQLVLAEPDGGPISSAPADGEPLPSPADGELPPAPADREPRITVEGAAFVVRVSGREPFARLPLRAGGAPFDALVERLERLAFERLLRASLGEHGVAEAELAVELGLVERGRPRPREAGALFAPGDSVYVRLQNRGERALHVHVFNLGISRTLALVSASHPLGIKLEPGREHVLGHHHATGALVGMKLWLPDDAPDASPLEESLVVFALTRPHSLQVLAAPTPEPTRGASRSPVEPAAGDATKKVALGGDRLADEAEAYLARELPFRLSR
ncbi:MAG: caspase family protein [Polyangiaceae bacterium]|nr:caspase family protein [Polyangiaceae bacterium]